MKLIKYNQLNNYLFELEFENGAKYKTDIASLIDKKVNTDELKTAHIDKDWGCLEFKGGLVDIEPVTLFKYVKQHPCE